MPKRLRRWDNGRETDRPDRDNPAADLELIADAPPSPPVGRAVAQGGVEQVSDLWREIGAVGEGKHFGRLAGIEIVEEILRPGVVGVGGNDASQDLLGELLF